LAPVDLGAGDHVKGGIGRGHERDNQTALC
jgi:hypothetical protein